VTIGVAAFLAKHFFLASLEELLIFNLLVISDHDA